MKLWTPLLSNEQKFHRKVWKCGKHSIQLEFKNSFDDSRNQENSIHSFEARSCGRKGTLVLFLTFFCSSFSSFPTNEGNPIWRVNHSFEWTSNTLHSLEQFFLAQLLKIMLIVKINPDDAHDYKIRGRRSSSQQLVRDFAEIIISKMRRGSKARGAQYVPAFPSVFHDEEKRWALMKVGRAQPTGKISRVCRGWHLSNLQTISEISGLEIRLQYLFSFRVIPFDSIGIEVHSLT